MEGERSCVERWHLSWGWEDRIRADVLRGRTIGKGRAVHGASASLGDEMGDEGDGKK